MPINEALFITETVKLTPSDSQSSKFIRNTGMIDNSSSPNYSVKKYYVLSGKTYSIRGINIAVTNYDPSYSLGIFKTSSDMSGSGSVIGLVNKDTPIGTKWDVRYTPSENGYIFLTSHSSSLVTELYEILGEKTGIEENKEAIQEILLFDEYVTSQLKQNKVISETKIEHVEQAGFAFVRDSGLISTTSNSGYSIRRFEVEKDKTYLAKLILSAVANVSPSYSGAMIKVSPDMNGSGDPIFQIPNGTPAGYEFKVLFTPTYNGNVFTSNRSPSVVEIFELNIEEVNSIEYIENKISEVESRIDDLGKGWDYLPALSENPLSNGLLTSGGMCSIFHSWGFVGDSFASGQMEFKVGSEIDQVNYYDFSWGQQICKLTGAEGYNFSYGGQFAGGWIASGGSGDASRRWSGAQTNLKTAYIIDMGRNDRRRWNISSSGAYPMGDTSTDIDLSNYNNNANTYAGNMAGIIQRLRSVQPKAPIFVLTRPKESDSYGNLNQWNEVCRELCQIFDNCWLIDLYTYAPEFDTNFKNKYYLGSHMSASGYQWMAYAISTYIDWIVRNNLPAFKNQGHVGTGREY